MDIRKDYILLNYWGLITIKIKIISNKKYSICSCGLSGILPYCDNAHRKFNSKNNTNYKSVKIISDTNIKLDIESSTWGNNDKEK